MGRIIEAEARITATDATGNTFDKIAGKIKALTQTAKAFDGIKPMGGMGWGAKFQKDVEALHVTGRELAGIQKNWEKFNSAMSRNGPIGAAKYFGAVDAWKNQTLSNLREVRMGLDETEKHQKKFFQKAGSFALHAVGIGGAAYAIGHGIKAVAKSAADRARERVRYEQMGFSGSEQSEADTIADSISAKYPALSRTEVIADLRKNASRLGGFDRAKEIADVYARAKISNKISGGDEHELEQVVRAAEGAGAANTPGQFASFLNAFSRAKAANPDYSGEDFAKDFRAAGAAKYGLGRDYMENVFPILASHTSGFGVKLATSNSALIGGRMTKQSKAALEAAGLLKNGKLIDEAGYQDNPYDWTQKHVRPLLEAKGVHFGEHMSEQDKRTTAAWATKAFSAKNTADQIITNLLDSALVERARERKTIGLEGMGDLQRKDPYIAFEGLTTQAKDLATAFISTKEAISAMNSAADEFSKRAKAVREGDWLSLLPEGDQQDIKSIREWWNTPSDRVEMNRRDVMTREQTEVDEKLRRGGYSDAVTRQLRMRSFELRSGIDASNNASNMPPIFSDAERSQWEEIERERRRGAAYSNLPGRGLPGIPLPMADPRKLFDGMPPVQSLEGANVQATLTGSAEVKGQAEVTVKVEAGSTLLRVVEQVKTALRLVGTLNANGPGSLGQSSPDAVAPPPPNTGGATGDW